MPETEDSIPPHRTVAELPVPADSTFTPLPDAAEGDQGKAATKKTTERKE